MATDGGVRHDAATVHRGDALATLRGMPSESVQCAITSPPYFALRSYLPDGHPDKGLEVGAEDTPAAYVARLVEVFEEVRRVLRDDGTCWINLGDSYASQTKGSGGTGKSGLLKDGRSESQRIITTDRSNGAAKFTPRRFAHDVKDKDLLGIPWRVAFALQDAGWYLRQDIVWAKPNPMPESVRDRCTKSHEYVFLLSKASRYFFDAEAIAEPTSEKTVWTYPQPDKAARAGDTRNGTGESTLRADNGTGTRNRRSVWTVTPDPYPGAHFAVMPPELVRPCVLAGTSGRGCCAACGSPWVRVVEREHNGATKGRRPDPRMACPSGKAEGSNTRGVPFVPSVTLGWAASCDCPPADPVPCTVLDPFAGSGTTLAVAVEEGRQAIGIELNPDYIGLIHRRLGGVTPGLFV